MLTTVFALLLALAQSPQAATPPLPDAPGSWRIHMTTNGGFGGDGSTYMAESNGNLKCSGTVHSCPEKLSTAALRNLEQKLKTATARPWAVPVPGNALCSDCASIEVELQLRMPDGSIRAFSTSWDVTNKSSVAPAVLQLVDAVSALGR